MNKRKTIYSFLATLLVIFVLHQIRNWNNEQKRENEKRNRDFVKSLKIEEHILPKNSYGQMKIDLLKLAPSAIEKQYRNRKVIAQIFDIGLDSSTVTIALRVDSVFGLLLPGKENNLYKIKNEEMNKVHNYLFYVADGLIDDMTKNDIYYTKPMKGELIYYIRTNSGSTFEKRLKLYDKNANIGWESFYCDIIHLFRTIDEFKEIGTLPENVYEQ